MVKNGKDKTCQHNVCHLGQVEPFDDSVVSLSLLSRFGLKSVLLGIKMVIPACLLVIFL